MRPEFSRRFPRPLPDHPAPPALPCRVPGCERPSLVAPNTLPDGRLTWRRQRLCPDHLTERGSRWRPRPQTPPPVCQQCGESFPRRYTGPNRFCSVACANAWQRAQYPGPRLPPRPGSVLRRAAVAALGGRCACCGESEPAFLAIDHIHGNGAQERREHSETWVYRRAAQDDGTNYRVLCHNCNLAYHHTGGCPHQGST